MSFIRTAFWVSLVIFLIPAGQHDQTDLMGTTKASFQNMNQFCERNKDVCDIGHEAWTSFKNKATYGAKTVFAYVKDQALSTPTSKPQSQSASLKMDSAYPQAKAVTAHQQPNGSFKVKATSQETKSYSRSQNTLTGDDLKPGWYVPSTGSDS